MQYTIGKYTFDNETEYNNGKNDVAIIKALREKCDLKNENTVKKILLYTEQGKIVFKSQIGKDFIAQLKNVVSVEEPKYMFCSQCGTKIDVEDVYCRKCGNKIFHRNSPEAKHYNNFGGQKKFNVFSRNNIDNSQPTEVNNAYVWMLNLIPITLEVIRILLWFMLSMQIAAVVVYFSCVLFLLLDYFYLKKIGIRMGIGWLILGLLISCIYLFRRAYTVDHKKGYAIFNLVMLIIDLVIMSILSIVIYSLDI